MEGAPVPVPRPGFVYSADDIFNLVRDKFWRDHADNQPQIKLHGLYDDVVKSQKNYDDYFYKVLVVEFNRWWSLLGNDEKIQASKLVVRENLGLKLDLQIPNDIVDRICGMSVG